MTAARDDQRLGPGSGMRDPPTETIRASGEEAFTSRRSVTVGLFVAIAQTAALAAAAVVTGSAALGTQAATHLADVAAGAFLLIGVVSSNRPADSSHPLGYGRERRSFRRSFDVSRRAC